MSVWSEEDRPPRPSSVLQVLTTPGPGKGQADLTFLVGLCRAGLQESFPLKLPGDGVGWGQLRDLNCYSLGYRAPWVVPTASLPLGSGRGFSLTALDPSGLTPLPSFPAAGSLGPKRSLWKLPWLPQNQPMGDRHGAPQSLHCPWARGSSLEGISSLNVLYSGVLTRLPTICR